MTGEEEQNEVDLLPAAQRGSTGAQDELVRRFTPMLERYLRGEVGKKLGRAVSVSDLCQETFVQSLRALDRLAPTASLDDFQAHLLRHAQWILGKQARHHERFRGESVAERAAQELEQPARTAGDVTRTDQREWMLSMVDRLDEKQAAVVRLRLQPMEFAEIAAELGISEMSARKRYVRGFHELRRRMGAEG